jgi:hypothetical protein
MTERIYPGTSIEVLDGNLSNNIAIPEDTVLIVDRAYTGPVGRLYYVSAAKDAATVFGSDSPLIKSMQRAFTGGAKNVALYRVGGKVASIENIFGLGTSLETAEASSVASTGLSVYIGPEPINPSLNSVIIYRNSRIIYSNVLGGEVDQGLVYVDGFNKLANEPQVGSFNDPVPLALVVQNLGTRVVITDSDVKTITIPAGDVALVSDHGLTVKVNGRAVRATDVTFDKVAGTVSFVTAETTFTVEVSYVKKYTPTELEDLEITFGDGEDLVEASWKDYYEAFDQALDDIQRVSLRTVAIGDVFNVPNLANGDTDADRLEYLNVEVDESGEKVFEWSTNRYLYRKGATTTTDISEADLTSNGQPIVVKQFHEVDFTHRVGMWGFERTEDGIYPNIMVGALGPRAYNSKYVNLWVGKEPTYNLDGKIIVNGSGLLGHRYMVGTINRTGGYFATDNGFPDGTPVTDSNGFIVDLGKYLSIVASQVTNSAGSLVVSSAASYAGLAATVTPGDSTTNQVVPGVTLLTDLKRARLKQLQAAGYVVLENRSKGVTVVSGDLASRLTSDYRYLSTSIVMNYIAADIAEVCDPFIGKGIDGTSKVALHTALHTRFQQRQRQGFFIDYLMQLRQVAPNVIDVAYTITAKDELRQVSNSIKLSREISNEVLS